jgi:CAAX prenyl protease-like protein
MDMPTQQTHGYCLTRAHVMPFAVFMAFMIFLQLVSALIGWQHPDAPWWRQNPAFLIYPVQTFVSLLVVYYYRRVFRFDWSWKWNLVAVPFGVLGIGLWLLPSVLYDFLELTEKPAGLLGWLGVQAREDGFDPTVFDNPAAWWLTVVLRFLRAVVVVAIIEEIFWRGFLMRFVLDHEGDFWKQPFGKASLPSYLIVTALFTLAHAPADYAGAFAYGSLTYFLCIWSKSLGACVVMHAVANLLLGLFIMATGKYGLW